MNKLKHNPGCVRAIYFNKYKYESPKSVTDGQNINETFSNVFFVYANFANAKSLTNSQLISFIVFKLFKPSIKIFLEIKVFYCLE